MLNKLDYAKINQILKRGNDVEIRRKPSTNEIIVIEVKKHIVQTLKDDSK